MADMTAPSSSEPLPLPTAERRKGTQWSETSPFALMMVITFGLFGMLVMMNFHAVPESSTTLMNIILGSIATAWVQGINYFFGSSAGAAKKDTALAAAAQSATKPAPLVVPPAAGTTP